MPRPQRPPAETPELDETLDLEQLGTRTVQQGKLVWTPPAGIDPALQKLVQNSVRALNARIERGELKLDANGDPI